ncbi:hypothetical protein C0992_000272 [Termitomyces sp. T32_za158]|nr:hypothetical protein C0992_000272 [Termitomyces sp. T32_za158]
MPLPIFKSSLRFSSYPLLAKKIVKERALKRRPPAATLSSNFAPSAMPRTPITKCTADPSKEPWAKNPPSSVWRYDRRPSPPARYRDRSRSPPPRRDYRRDDRREDRRDDRRDDRDRDRDGRREDRERERRRSRTPDRDRDRERRRSASPRRSDRDRDDRREERARTPPPPADAIEEKKAVEERGGQTPPYEH